MRRFLITLLAAASITSLSIGAAQDMTPTLRELAERNNLYIGAAVYTSHLNDPAHVETLSREFNMLTPENEAKACEVQPELGHFDFRKFDQLVDFAEAHQMEVHGHTLVWHQCVPDWLANGEYTRDEAINLLRDHIYTVVGRYKGRVPIWDVVNEGIDDSGGIRETPWQRLIGDDYIEIAFRFAHEADPDALLFYNDYGAESMNRKSNAVYELVRDLVAREIPIHGVGLQGHFTLGGFNVRQIGENMARIAELGLQVQITEMDVRYDGATTEDNLRQQAEQYREVMEVCLNADNCTAFIVWGVSDKLSWLRGDSLGFFNNPTVEPLLFDDNYQPKPAYNALIEVLAEQAGE